MLIKFTADHDVRMSDVFTKTFPAGWEGDVDDKLAASAIKLGRAERVATAPVVDPTLPPAKDDGKAKG